MNSMTGEPADSRLRQIASLILPREHGSWSLALEPVALGVLAAPSAAGVALAAAALTGFFLRRPFKLVLSNKSDPRRTLAIGCTIILAMFALVNLLLAARIAGALKLWPLIPAAVAAMAFAWFDLRGESREGAAELAGATAFGILPAAFAALAGWNAIESLAIAVVMLARSLPTVLFVRTYLRRHKGRPVTVVPALIAVSAGFFLTIWLVFTRTAPWPAAVFAFLLAARTFWLLASRNLRIAARTMGMAEMASGVAMVLTLALTWKCL